jgi:MFS transporter, ACS family, glucarate transporter
MDAHSLATQPSSTVTQDTRIPNPRRLLPYLFLLSVVTYLDRVNISIAAPSIRTEFGIDPVRMGVIFSAFVVGYMLFQIPGGWVGDRYGHKKILI